MRGIPGADGIAYPQKAGRGGGANVLFRERRCVLLVGDSDAGSARYRLPAIAGATAIWKRTHAGPGVCRG